jgi:hypothetical protein
MILQLAEAITAAIGKETKLSSSSWIKQFTTITLK